MDLNKLSVSECILLSNLLSSDADVFERMSLSNSKNYTAEDKTTAARYAADRRAFAERFNAHIRTENTRVLRECEELTETDQTAQSEPVVQLTVGDLSAALSRFKATTPLGVVLPNGKDALISLQASASFKPTTSYSVDSCIMFLWDKEANSATEQANILGKVTPRPEVKDDEPINRGDKLVNASINELPLLPVMANPFHYDSTSMGTRLVRDWYVMHAGYDANEDQRGLMSVTLFNRRSGQRFFVDLSRIDADTDFMREEVKAATTA